MADTPHQSTQAVALRWLSGFVAGATQDLDRMKAAHPPSKRGSRYTHALESLEARLTAAAQVIEEANRE